MSLAATAQLLERLKAQTEAQQGDLYGLIPECGKPSAVAMALLVEGESQDMGHSPALLLPPPLTRIGVFNVTNGEAACPELEDGEVALVWDGREVLWYSSSSSEGSAVQVLGAAELHALFAVAKVTFSLELWCRQSARDSSRDPTPTPTPGQPTATTKGNAAALCEELDSAAACFRLRGGQLLLHAGGDDGGGGVLCGGGTAVGAGDAAGSVLFKAATGKKKGGGGSGGGQQEVTFQLLYNRSAVVGEVPALAPVVRVDNCETAVVCASVSGEAAAYVDKRGSVAQLAGVLARAVAAQVRLAQHWLALQRGHPELRGSLTSLATLPHTAGHLVGLVYPAGGDEEALKVYRAAVHRALVFPLDRPMVRRANALTPAPGTRPSALANPHASLTAPGLGEVAMVRGSYAYYHYLQGKVEDKGWGCAYRSLQTIVSWYQMQGYTSRPLPSHRDIQQCLVDIGDKQHDFIGSKKWIGSTEVGFVLETLFGIRSRFLCVSSGGELAQRGMELAHHFNTQGTPVMVGGGVLAHTILGVDWDDTTQNTAFLVLDPHYTGPDDTATVIAKGGVAWKNADFWKTDAFYNLCLPQRPTCY